MKRRLHRSGAAACSPRRWQHALAGTLNQALQHHQAGQLDAAAHAHRDVLRAMPDQPDALHLLGVLALQRGQPAEAVPLIQRAIAVRDDNAVYYGNLGVALQALGRAEEARAEPWSAPLRSIRATSMRCSTSA